MAAITIDDIVPVRNDYFKRIETNNYIGDTSVPFMMNVEFAPPKTFSLIDITFNDGYNFVIDVSAIGISGIPAPGTGLPTTDIDFAELVDYALQNSAWNERYIITYDPQVPNTLTFKEKTIRNVSIVSSSTDGTVVLSFPTYGDEGALYSAWGKYKFFIDVYKNTSNGYENIFRGSYIPKAPTLDFGSGILNINIGEILKNTLKPFLPSSASFQYAFARDSWNSFMIRGIEYYDEGLSETYYSNIFQAYYSGLSNKNGNAFQQSYLGSAEHLNNARCMDLFFSSSKITRANLPEYLYVWVKDLWVDSSSYLSVYIEYFDASGSSMATQSFNTSAYLSTDLVLCVAAGTYNNSTIKSYLSTHNVKSYLVSVYDPESSAFICNRTYVIDNSYLPNALMFEYINNLGAMCSFFTKGESSYGLSLKADSVTIDLQKEFETKTFETFEYNTVVSEEFEANTGWIETKKEAESLLQFFASEHKFLFAPNPNYARMAIIVDTKSIAVWKTSVGYYQFTFRYKYAQSSKVISPTITVL